MDEEQIISKHKKYLISLAYFYLKFRQRTRAEMEQYLNKKSQEQGIEQAAIEQVLIDLERQNLINDKIFIESFVSSHQNTRQKGECALRHELARKGISEILLNEYFSNNPLDELMLAREALKKILPRLCGFDAKKKIQRVRSYLQRRGFNFDVIHDAIEETGLTE